MFLSEGTKLPDRRPLLSLPMLAYSQCLSWQTGRGLVIVMVVILVVGGIQMLMRGVLGEYLWQALDESGRRPRCLIATTTDVPSDTVQR